MCLRNLKAREVVMISRCQRILLLLASRASSLARVVRITVERLGVVRTVHAHERARKIVGRFQAVLSRAPLPA